MIEYGRERERWMGIKKKFLSLVLFRIVKLHVNTLHKHYSDNQEC